MHFNRIPVRALVVVTADADIIIMVSMEGGVTLWIAL